MSKTGTVHFKTVDSIRVDGEPKGAVFTEERTHRLYLWRRWHEQRAWLMFIGLNPSTADERLDDPTVRRLRRCRWL
jgi:hypothetical protein